MTSHKTSRLRVSDLTQSSSGRRQSVLGWLWRPWVWLFVVILLGVVVVGVGVKPGKKGPNLRKSIQSRQAQEAEAQVPETYVVDSDILGSAHFTQFTPWATPPQGLTGYSQAYDAGGVVNMLSFYSKDKVWLYNAQTKNWHTSGTLAEFAQYAENSGITNFSNPPAVAGVTPFTAPDGITATTQTYDGSGVTNYITYISWDKIWIYDAVGHTWTFSGSIGDYANAMSSWGYPSFPSTVPAVGGVVPWSAPDGITAFAQAYDATNGVNTLTFISKDKIWIYDAYQSNKRWHFAGTLAEFASSPAVAGFPNFGNPASVGGVTPWNSPDGITAMTHTYDGAGATHYMHFISKDKIWIYNFSNGAAMDWIFAGTLVEYAQWGVSYGLTGFDAPPGVRDCEPGYKVCDAKYGGVVVCNVDRLSFSPQDDCRSKEMTCSESQCRCPADRSACFGKVSKTCNAAGTAWTENYTCLDTQQCQWGRCFEAGVCK